jgi:hypothetical protein
MGTDQFMTELDLHNNDDGDDEMEDEDKVDLVERVKPSGLEMANAIGQTSYDLMSSSNDEGDATTQWILLSMEPMDLQNGLLAFGVVAGNEDAEIALHENQLTQFWK